MKIELSKDYISIILEKGTPVDLLPDRQAAILATWLKNHPGVQLISRDRAGECARGAGQGTPTALQTADRFHILRNLTETMERVLGRHRKALKQLHLVWTPASSPSVLLRHHRPDRERTKQHARAVLRERDVAVQRPVKQGLSHHARARQLHMPHASLMREASADHFPAKPERPVALEILAPYETSLRTRFLEGERDVLGLFRESVARGYTSGPLPCSSNSRRCVRQRRGEELDDWFQAAFPKCFQIELAEYRSGAEMIICFRTTSMLCLPRCFSGSIYTLS